MGEGTNQPRPDQQRLLVRDAALVLGISEGAVRMRVKRGTLPSVREGGRLYVLLERDPTTDPERTHDRDNDRTSELIATLREQLQAERQAHAEARRIIAGLVERIPALEPPGEPEPVEEEADRAEPRPATGGAQEGAQQQTSTLRDWSGDVQTRRPWWRRMFGG